MAEPSERGKSLLSQLMLTVSAVAIPGDPATETAQHAAAEAAYTDAANYIEQLELRAVPFIEIVRFRGKESQFSKRLATMCHVNLVGIDGSKKALVDHPVSENYALSISRQWQPLLGCKVRFFRETVDTKVDIVEEYQ